MMRILFLSLLSVLFSSCVHLDELIQINQNGSAKIVVTYSMPVEGLALLSDCEAVLNDLNNRDEKVDLPRIFDADKLKEHFKKFAGVDIISVRVTRIKGNRIEAYFNLQIEDFRKSLRDGLLPYTTLQRDGDNYVFEALYPFNLSKIKEDPKLLKALSDIKVNFRVKTPTAITKTNAPVNADNQAEWKFSAEDKPFTECDGRFSVYFKADGISFLDERKKE